MMHGDCQGWKQANAEYIKTDFEVRM